MSENEKQLSAALAVEAGAGLSVDALAQEIRRVDGNHSLGAGALAEALMPFLAALTPASSAVEGEAVRKPLWQQDAENAEASAKEIRAMLSGPAPTPAGAWRPIDTADKEAGRMLLGIVRNGNLEEVHIGFYSFAYNEDEVDCWWSEQGDDEIVPTHWAPLFLPASPAPHQEGRADG